MGNVPASRQEGQRFRFSFKLIPAGGTAAKGWRDKLLLGLSIKAQKHCEMQQGENEDAYHSLQNIIAVYVHLTHNKTY